MYAGACVALMLPACASAPPRRQSRELTLVEALPEARAFVWLNRPNTNPAHTAWVYRAGDPLGLVIELHDGEGVVASTPGPDLALFDVAPDRSAAVCTDEEVRVFDGSSWSVTRFADLAPLEEGVGHRCAGLAMRGQDDVWLVLSIVGASVPDRICHSSTSGWVCAELEGRAHARSLVLTAGHAWWLSGLDLVAIDTSRSPLVIEAVASGLAGTSRLQGSTDSESVLVTVEPDTGPGMTPTPAPELISIDGARAAQETAYEGSGYEAVWLAPGDRVLALDVESSSTCSSGSSGPYGYVGGGGGSSCTREWTQLVLFELGDGAPVELAHANDESGRAASLAVAIERVDGTYLSVAGGGWYH